VGFLVESGIGTDFSLSTLVFPRQFHSTGVPLIGKMEETTHLHHREEECVDKMQAVLPYLPCI
jgi:hypothetical protein